MKARYVNIYWSLLAIEEANFLPGNNLIFVGKIYNTAEEAREVARQQKPGHLKYIDTIKVPNDIEIPSWP